MPEHVEVLFENLTAMMRKLKKNSYEENMKKFREDHGEVIEEMLSTVKASGNTVDSAEHLGADFANRVYDAFAVKG